MPHGESANDGPHIGKVPTQTITAVDTIITVDGYEARVKRVGERDDGIIHARIRRLDADADEIAYRDPTTGLWRLGRAKLSPDEPRSYS